MIRRITAIALLIFLVSLPILVFAKTDFDSVAWDDTIYPFEIHDEFDSGTVINVLSKYNSIESSLDNFRARVRSLSENEIAHIFGPSVEPQSKTMALPCSQPRAFGLNDGGCGKPKKEFYQIGDYGGIYFFHDECKTSWSYLVFRVDDAFQKLTQLGSLDKRLEWEEVRMKQIEAWFNNRVAHGPYFFKETWNCPNR